MSTSFFEPLLSYLDEPGCHLRSEEASRIIEELAKSAKAWRGARIASEPLASSQVEPIIDPLELIEAMQLGNGALDTRLLDDLLMYTISQ